MTQEKNKILNTDGSSSDTKPERVDSNEIVNLPEETGGPSGPEPTRYGDWERKGRCIDF